MTLSKQAAMMCAIQLLNNFPALLKQEKPVLDALKGQLVYLFGEMDEETAQACLAEYPLKHKFLTAFEVNVWREAHEAQRRKVEEIQRASRKTATIGKLKTTLCKPTSTKRSDALAEVQRLSDVLLAGRTDKNLISVEPYTDEWLAWFHWQANNDCGNVFMLKQAEDGKPWTVPCAYPPVGGRT